VMYLGKVMEEGNTSDVFLNPIHPYTQSLISAIPGISENERIILEGDIPSPMNYPNGCVFNTRCRKVFSRCKVEIPALYNYDNKKVGCFLYEN